MRDRWLIDTVRLAWRTRILGHIESDLRLRLCQIAEDAAVQVFAGNLRDLLLAAPAGARPTMGLDPGYRTGVKVAVVSETGQTAATTTIYPHPTPRAFAVFKIPAPVASCAQMRSTTSSLTGRRPRRFP